MEIIQRLIPASNTETRPGLKLVPTYITIHETDNTSPGADAERHAELQQRGNSRQASWHVQVDDKEAIQSIPFDEVAWAAGDGYDGPGNRNSIHIEICVNSDGDFKKAVSNAAEVTRQLMQQFNISLNHIVQHNHWTGKDCPRYLRSGEKGLTWAGFLDMVKANLQYKVIIPNTSYWQAKALVSEFEKRGYKAYGHNLKSYGPDEKPQRDDPYYFIIETDYETAKKLVIELKTRGYDRTFGTAVK